MCTTAGFIMGTSFKYKLSDLKVAVVKRIYLYIFECINCKNQCSIVKKLLFIFLYTYKVPVVTAVF